MSVSFKGDMRRLDLGQCFEVVLCVFDVIDHLLTFEEWEEVFDRVKRRFASVSTYDGVTPWQALLLSFRLPDRPAIW